MAPSHPLVVEAASTYVKDFKVEHGLSKGLTEVKRSLRNHRACLLVVADDVTPPDFLADVVREAAEDGVPVVSVPTKVQLGTLAGIKHTATVLTINGGPPLIPEVVAMINAAVPPPPPELAVAPPLPELAVAPPPPELAVAPPPPELAVVPVPEPAAPEA